MNKPRLAEHVVNRSTCSVTMREATTQVWGHAASRTSATQPDFLETLDVWNFTSIQIFKCKSLIHSFKTMLESTVSNKTHLCAGFGLKTASVQPVENAKL